MIPNNSQHGVICMTGEDGKDPRQLLRELGATANNAPGIDPAAVRSRAHRTRRRRFFGLAAAGATAAGLSTFAIPSHTPTSTMGLPATSVAVGGSSTSSSPHPFTTDSANRTSPTPSAITSGTNFPTPTTSTSPTNWMMNPAAPLVYPPAKVIEWVKAAALPSRKTITATAQPPTTRAAWASPDGVVQALWQPGYDAPTFSCTGALLHHCDQLAPGKLVYRRSLGGAEYLIVDQLLASGTRLAVTLPISGDADRFQDQSGPRLITMAERLAVKTLAWDLSPRATPTPAPQPTPSGTRPSGSAMPQEPPAQDDITQPIR